MKTKENFFNIGELLRLRYDKEFYISAGETFNGVVDDYLIVTEIGNLEASTGQYALCDWVIRNSPIAKRKWDGVSVFEKYFKTLDIVKIESEQERLAILIKYSK